MDWADELAGKIHFDVTSMPDTPESKAATIRLIAARLRLVRQQGMTEGVDQAANAMKIAFAKKE